MDITVFNQFPQLRVTRVEVYQDYVFEVPDKKLLISEPGLRERIDVYCDLMSDDPTLFRKIETALIPVFEDFEWALNYPGPVFHVTIHKATAVDPNALGLTIAAKS